MDNFSNGELTCDLCCAVKRKEDVITYDWPVFGLRTYCT